MNNESSSCSKRPRETESTLKRSKRVCLENVIEENNDVKTCSTQCSVKDSPKSNTPDCLGENNKENVNINLNTQVRSEQSVNTKLMELSEMQSNTVTNQSECTKVMTNQESDQSKCENPVTKQSIKKSNWLRDMGVKKKNLNKVSRKVKPSSQPSSPLLQEPSSPSTVSDYFVF